MRNRLLIIGIFLLGILFLMGIQWWLSGWYAPENFLLIVPVIIASSILLKNRFGEISGLQSPSKTGYMEVVVAALLLGFGLYEFADTLFYYGRGYLDSALWVLGGIACLILTIKTRNRDLIALIFMLFFTYIMMLSWGIDLFVGCPGVAGPCIYYDDFAVPFLGMIVANIASGALEKSSSLFRKLYLRVTLPLFLMAVFAVLSSGYAYATAGSVVGMAGAAVPLARPLLALGILLLPAGVKFGWAPWSGAPIDTLTPRVWILLALAVAFVIFERLLQRLRGLAIMDGLSSQFTKSLLKRRILVTSIIVSSLGIWYGIGLRWILCSPFRVLIGIVLFLYLVKYAVDSLFVHSQLASETVEMEDDTKL